MDAAQVRKLLRQLRDLPENEAESILRELEDIERAEKIQASRDKFMSFVRRMWPSFIEGSHHKIMADKFERIASGDLKRLMIHMPPRHTKSEFASYLLPAWYIGKFPDRKIIQATHTSNLSVSFGRKVKTLLGHRDYKETFPGVSLRADAKASGHWLTNHGGEYFAIGTGGNIAGHGADLFVIDDPHSEQHILTAGTAAFDKDYEWYASGPRQRLQPNAAIVIVATRWSKRDIPARLMRLADTDPMADQWEVIDFPAIMPARGERPEQSLWPEYWTLKELLRTKASISPAKWLAQYQQTPTSEEGAIVKAEWWQVWDHATTPKMDFIIQSWDTAFDAKDTANPSACTTWGIFSTQEKGDRNYRQNVMLLDAFAERMSFPTLKERAYAEYNRWRPDCIIVEARASGLPLVQELRMRNIPVEEFTPTRGKDKTVRVNSVADMFQSGMVWARDVRFAQEVKMQFADFPAGEYDDLVDSSTQALMRIRQGGLIRLPTDWDAKEEPTTVRRVADYY